MFAFFGKVIWGNQQFAFRDGAHFYFPLFRYLRDELWAGRFPFWTPYENLGQPLLGNPVCSVFYPGKLLFLLPLDYTFAYHLYILAHVLLSAGTMYGLSRSFRKSPIASTLSSLAYAFGGIVLYQHLNVIFLIGAAWLPESLRIAFRLRKLYKSNPFGLRGVENSRLFSTESRISSPSGFSYRTYRTLKRRAIRKGSFALSAVLAMMVFGGDIHGAYHAVLIVVLILGPRKSLFPILFAGLLTAVQVLPSWEFSKWSDRSEKSVPRSLWEAPHAKDSNALCEGLLCRNLDRRGHARSTYIFSVSPWRTAEFFWPNFGGIQYPINARWITGSGWDQSVWVPSLYCGMLPMLLALSVFRLFPIRKNFPGFSVMSSRLFLVFLLGSFGLFGIGWILNVCFYGAEKFGDSPSGWGHPVGGIYWMMNILLPGYSQFRYPAKLLVVAVVPLSLLVAIGWDHLLGESGTTPEKKRKPGSMEILSVLFICISLTSLILVNTTSLWEGFSQKASGNSFFGPYDSELAKSNLMRSFLQPVFVLVLFLVLLKLWKRKKLLNSSLFGAITVLLVAVDLFTANSWMVPTTDREDFSVSSPLKQRIRSDTGLPPTRIYRFALWYPGDFTKKSSEERFSESVQFDRASLWPKYNLEDHIAIVDVQGTTVLKSYSERLKHLRSSKEHFADRLAEIGVQYLVFPARIQLKNSKVKRIYVDFNQDYSLWEISRPASWIRSLSENPTDSEKPDFPGTVEILHYGPDKIVVETDLPEPQRLVFSEQYYPGWTAKIVDEQGVRKSMEIHPVDEIFRGVDLPAGKSRLVLRYVPTGFYPGLVISLASWSWGLFRLRFKKCDTIPIATPGASESGCATGQDFVRNWDGGVRHAPGGNKWEQPY